MSNRDTQFQWTPICPKCGRSFNDAWEWDFGPSAEGECETDCDCGCTFICSRAVEVTYSTKAKPDGQKEL